MSFNYSIHKGFILLVSALFLPCVTNGRIFSKKPVRFVQFCKDGYAHDKLFPDPYPFTCKPGPGRIVKCQNILYNLKGSFRCPEYGYASGWEFKEGIGLNVRCCEDPDIKYSHKDCKVHLNSIFVYGGSYRVYKGKVMTGFTTFDNGKTWYNNECSYRACRRY